MKLFLFILGLTLVNARGVFEPVTLDYHETVGIPTAERLRNAETAQDFDGARIIGGQLASLGSNPYLVITVFKKKALKYITLVDSQQTKKISTTVFRGSQYVSHI